MFMSNVRAAALAGVVLATLGLPAQAAHHGDCGSPCGSPCADAAPCGPVAPAFRTVTVTEWVPETYKTMATAYRTEYVNEAYTAYRTENFTEKFTAYRTECASEPRTRQFTVYNHVPVTNDVTVSVWNCVPSIEKRTVHRTVVSYQPYTTVVRKCVDQGHWECREVPVETFHSRMKKHFHKKSDCCEPCAPVCVPTKTVKVWVPNKVWVEVPVTSTRAVCNTVTETIDVTVNRMVESKEVRKVTTYRCVPSVKTETYTVLVPRQVAYEASRIVCKTVPYQATRQVARSVPYQTEVTATRMVARTVERQVAAESCYGVTVSSSGIGGHRLFGKMGGKGHGHKKAACCD